MEEKSLTRNFAMEKKILKKLKKIVWRILQNCIQATAKENTTVHFLFFQLFTNGLGTALLDKRMN